MRVPNKNDADVNFSFGIQCALMLLSKDSQLQQIRFCQCPGFSVSCDLFFYRW